MIQKVSFRNFKAYRSLDLELEPLTVVVGPNASGKTTLLEGLELVSQVTVPSIRPKGFVAVWELLARRSHGSDGPLELGVSGTWNGKNGRLQISRSFRETVASKHSEQLGIGAEDKPQPTPVFEISGEWDGQQYRGDLPNANAVLSSTKVLRFEQRRLADVAYSDEAIPTVHSDGGGLAALLAYLKLERDEIFEAIELALVQVVPSVRRIRIERAAVEQTSMRTISLDQEQHQVPDRRKLWGHRVVLDMKGAKGVAADSAGEGTLMVLGLLSILIGPERPRLILLDDIELGLHPLAQGKLIEVLRKIQKLDPELQIIATSHSPFILNYLDPKEVRMTFLAENGFARCEKLTAHPEFERWKDLMSPGEFWSTVGESWLEKAGETASHE